MKRKKIIFLLLIVLLVVCMVVGCGWLLTPEGDFPQREKGVEHSLTRPQNEADSMHQEENAPVDDYELDLDNALDNTNMPTDVGLMSDEELAGYLLSSVPEADDLVRLGGMAVLVTGETTELPHEGECRDLWLGTSSRDSFVREILYTVSTQGAIYQYDPLEDDWNKMR